ncbi:MAG: hypothetical protein H0T56_05365 [Pseudaminobacter sp.]|nr:hypothetical protein [Pseudaminobacter sp.]
MSLMKTSTKSARNWSRAFFDGFGRGFIAPSLMFAPLNIRRDKRFDVSVEKAWEDVGRILSGSMAAEDILIGKKTGILRTDQQPKQRISA